MHRLTISMIAPFGIRPKGTLIARMLPLAQVLSQAGHSVRIVAPAVLNPDDAGTSQVLGGVTVLHSALARLPGSLGAIEQARLLWQDACANKPDLLHLFKPKGFGGLSVLANSHIPLLIDSDDWEGWGGWNELLSYPALAKSLFAWQEQNLPRRARAVTVVSRTLERQMRGLGLAPERIFYIPNGSHLSTLRERSVSQAGNRLLLYSRFWEFRVADLVPELVTIFQHYPDAHVWVIGKGEHAEEQELLGLATRAGIADRLQFYGWVEPERIPGLLAACDIALVPMQNTLINRARGLAKLLELMQAGLAIAAHNVGQVGEYLRDQESALLVPAEQSGALAMAAMQLLEDSALRSRLASGAQHAAQRFSWTRLAGTLEEAYWYALRG